VVHDNGAVAAEQVITFRLVIIFTNAVSLVPFHFCESQAKDLMNLNRKYAAAIIWGGWR